MFRLNDQELEHLKSQFVTAGWGHGGRRSLPYAFTEHGVAMLSSILNSKRAIALNILIMRAFIRLRDCLATHQDLAPKLEDLERTQDEHGAHIQQIYDYIQRLIDPPSEPGKRQIGF